MNGWFRAFLRKWWRRNVMVALVRWEISIAFWNYTPVNSLWTVWLNGNIVLLDLWIVGLNSVTCSCCLWSMVLDTCVFHTAQLSFACDLHLLSYVHWHLNRICGLSLQHVSGCIIFFMCTAMLTGHHSIWWHLVRLPLAHSFGCLHFSYCTALLSWYRCGCSRPALHSYVHWHLFKIVIPE
jgi:hypothetical protein